jgi:cytochrome c oxidase subunit 2
VIAGIVVPGAVLVALFVLTVDALPKTSPSRGSARFEIDVVARQWFWDVSYPATRVRTANEIHLPVGIPVDVRVRSADVIHSLWVPELNRKIDVIPGQVNDVVFDARRRHRLRLPRRPTSSVVSKFYSGRTASTATGLRGPTPRVLSART